MVHQRRVVFTLHGCLLVTGTHNFGASCACRATAQLARTRFHSAATQETRAGAVASQARCCCTHVYVVCVCTCVCTCVCMRTYVHAKMYVCLYCAGHLAFLCTCACLGVFAGQKDTYVCMYLRGYRHTYMHRWVAGWVILFAHAVSVCM